MKEIKSEIKQDVQLHAQKEVEKKTVFIGSLRKEPGLTLWVYNVIHKTLSKAAIETKAVYSGSKVSYKNNVRREPGDQFFYALNEKNARKKVAKQGLEIL